MGRTCTNCGTSKFGLVQHRLLTFNGYLYFCSLKCRQQYQKQQQEEIRKRQFLNWLRNK